MWRCRFCVEGRDVRSRLRHENLVQRLPTGRRVCGHQPRSCLREVVVGASALALTGADFHEDALDPIGINVRRHDAGLQASCEVECDELCAVGDDSVRPPNRVAYQSAVRRIAHAPIEVRGNDAFAGVVRHRIFFRWATKKTRRRMVASYRTPFRFCTPMSRRLQNVRFLHFLCAF